AAIGRGQYRQRRCRGKPARRCAAMAIDPELRRLATFLPRGAIGPRSLPIIRRLTALQSRRVPADVEVTQLGPISVRVHRPRASAEPLPALLWVHGGGYVMGNPAQDDGLCRLVAQRLGVLVAATSYRLAPEHPFPTGLHDCHDALVWLAAR